MPQSNQMSDSFDERVEQAWAESDWIIEDMFDNGMCFFEGFIPSVDLAVLDSALPHLTDSPVNCQYSVWSNDTSESDWNRTYPLADYISFFRNGRILMLHVDYSVAVSGFDFTLKLIFEPDADLEIIFYRENLLPRTETRDRFVAACHYLSRLKSTFNGPALFLGPDTLNYPVWPDVVPKEWQRLL